MEGDDSMLNRSFATTGLLMVAMTLSGCMTAVAAFQPENIGGETIVITTFDEAGEGHERVISPIELEGTLFVSANHWPRAWYRRALARPELEVRRADETRRFRAVPVSAEERERLLDAPGFPKIAYLFTGFAPRRFLRLEPI